MEGKVVMTKIKEVAKRYNKNLDTLARELGPMYVGLGLGELLGEGLTSLIVKGGNYTPFLRKRMADQVVIYSVLTAVGAGIVTVGEIYNEAKEKSEAETVDETCEGSDESFAE